jgi:hypothetical protein
MGGVMHVLNIEVYYRDLIGVSCQDTYTARMLCRKLRELDIKCEEIYEQNRGWGAVKLFFMPWKMSERNNQLFDLLDQWKGIINQLINLHIKVRH